MAVSPEQHYPQAMEPGTRFRMDADYRFARNLNRVELSLPELRRMVGALPIVLARGEHSWQLQGLMGLPGTSNLMIDVRGRWLGPSVPELLMLFPLGLNPGEQADNAELMIFGASQRLEDGLGKVLREEDGNNTDLYGQYLELLQAREQGKAAIAATALQLYDHGLLSKMGKDDGSVTGLYSARPEAMENVSAEVLADLNQSQALELYYALWYSRGNLVRLRRLARAQGSAPAELKAGAEALPALLPDDTATGFNFDID